MASPPASSGLMCEVFSATTEELVSTLTTAVEACFVSLMLISADDPSVGKEMT